MPGAMRSACVLLVYRCLVRMPGTALCACCMFIGGCETGAGTTDVTGGSTMQCYCLLLVVFECARCVTNGEYGDVIAYVSLKQHKGAFYVSPAYVSLQAFGMWCTHHSTCIHDPFLPDPQT
jgi:hypothetical protein